MEFLVMYLDRNTWTQNGGVWYTKGDAVIYASNLSRMGKPTKVFERRPGFNGAGTCVWESK